MTFPMMAVPRPTKVVRGCEFAPGMLSSTGGGVPARVAVKPEAPGWGDPLAVGSAWKGFSARLANPARLVRSLYFIIHGG